MSEDRNLEDFCRDRSQADVSDDFTDRVMAAVRAKKSGSPLGRLFAIVATSAALVVFAFRVVSIFSIFSV